MRDITGVSLLALLCFPGYSQVGAGSSSTSADSYATANQAAAAIVKAGGGDLHLMNHESYVLQSTLTLGSATTRVHLHIGSGARLVCAMMDGSDCIVKYDGSSIQADAGVTKGTLNIGGNGYITLANGAHVHDVVANAVQDGTQQSFSIDGLYVIGNPNAIVDGALVHLRGLFSSTTIHNLTIEEIYDQIGLLIDTPGADSVLNITSVLDLQNLVISGNNHPGARPFVISSVAGGTVGDIWCHSCDIEAAAPGGAEIEINGGGYAAPGNHAGSIAFFGLHLEAGAKGTGAGQGVKIRDADNVAFYNVSGNCAVCSPGGSMIDVGESGAQHTYNITVFGLMNLNWPIAINNHINNYVNTHHEIGGYHYAGVAWNGELVDGFIQN